MRRLGGVLTTRGRAFGAAGATLVACGYLLGFPDITRVGVLLVVLPLLTGLLASRRPPAVQVTRETAPVRVVAGESATVTTTVENAGRSATALLLAQERLDHALGDGPRVLLGSLGFQERRAFTYAVRPPVRGRHLLGPLTAQVRDPFGMTTRFVDVGQPSELIALPRTFPLGGSRPPGTGVGAEGEIPFMVALHGEDDQSIREYRDGDDLRRIHWPATARTGELMVRQEDRPARRRGVVLLDPRRDAHQGRGEGSSVEWAVSAAASVVVHLADLGYAVHLLTPETVHDGHADQQVEPGPAVEGLAVTELADSLELTQLTRAAQSLLAGGGVLVAVVVGHDEQALRRIAAVRQPGSTALALVLDGPAFAAGFGTADRSARAPHGDAAVAVDLLRAAGWRATTVGPADSVTAAWGRLAGTQQSAPLRAGANR